MEAWIDDQNAMDTEIDACLVADALELLKEQKNRIDVLRSEVKRLDVDIVRCKDCKHYPDGSGTKWTPCREIIVPPCWFCADGEKKE